MKNTPFILNIKLLLTIAFMGISALGFSQSTDANVANHETRTEVRFDFMGTDLSTQSPPQLNGLKNLSENNQFPELKSAEFNHSRVDSIVGMTNYGPYIESWNWQFNYDENNKLTTSVQHYYDTFNKFRNKKELRKYDANGQVLSVVRTERTYLNVAFVTSYKEENEYANGNLIKQTTVQLSLGSNYYDSGGGLPGKTETTFTYNEKNQLTKTATVITQEKNDGSKSVSKTRTEYFYDEDGRKIYDITFPTNNEWFVIAPIMYEYITSDSTLLIKEKKGWGAEYRTPPDLAKFSWKDSYNFRLAFDQYGRTKSIEKSYPISGDIIFKTEYEYTASGKLKQITLTSDDIKDLPTNYGRTIIKNTYDDQDNLLKYERMFYNSVTDKWVDEELKTYYYSSIKSVSTSNDQHKTDNLHIFPNPAGEVLYLSVSPEPGTSYAICNSMGVVVSHGLLKSPSISVSQLKPGIYFLKIRKNKPAPGFKFIKR